MEIYIYYISNWAVLTLLLHYLFSAVECEQLSAPANGFFKAACDKVYNSECEFDCNTGYNLVGTSLRRCQSDKTWSGTPVQCNSKFSVVMFDFSSANCHLIHRFIHSFIYSFTRSFRNSFVRTSIYLPIHSFVLSSFIASPIHPSIHPSTCRCICTFAHPFIHSIRITTLSLNS